MEASGPSWVLSCSGSQPCPLVLRVSTVRRGERRLGEFPQRGLGGDADEAPAEEEAAEEPDVLHTGADRGAGERSGVGQETLVSMETATAAVL